MKRSDDVEALRADHILHLVQTFSRRGQRVDLVCDHLLASGTVDAWIEVDLDTGSHTSILSIVAVFPNNLRTMTFPAWEPRSS